MERWTPEQLQASVEGYLEMREIIARGGRVNKAQFFRGLASKYGKDTAAWARRFGNVSQVMDELGYRLIPGIRPLPNVGTKVTKMLIEMIQARIGDVDAGLAPRTVRAELIEAEKAANASQEFSPQDAADYRHRVLRSVVLRRGQPAFRKALIEIYGGSCAISGCAIVDLLEAAHIYPYRDGTTNDLSNGLLLRADLHTLFDLRLISIDPESMRVVTSAALTGTTYEHFSGLALRARASGTTSISKQSLKWHRQQCTW